MKLQSVLSSAIASVLFSVPVWSQAPVTEAEIPSTRPADAKKPAIKPPTPEQIILRQLRSGDNEQVQVAISAIREALTGPDRGRDDAGKRLAEEWGKAMLEAKAYDALAELALIGQTNKPADLRRLEVLQTFRVRSLLAMGKTQEAIVAARSLFNVSGMGYTREALIVMADAIRAAYPNDAETYNRFVSEQLEAARASTQPTTLPAKGSASVKEDLASVAADSAAYASSLDQPDVENYGGLYARGNLLLLAGRAAEAKKVFDRAYTLAPDNKLAEATEALARVMKAEDGSVGRANQFVLSLRPVKP